MVQRFQGQCRAWGSGTNLVKQHTLHKRPWGNLILLLYTAKKDFHLSSFSTQGLLTSAHHRVSSHSKGFIGLVCHGRYNTGFPNFFPSEIVQPRFLNPSHSLEEIIKLILGTMVAVDDDGSSFNLDTDHEVDVPLPPQSWLLSGGPVIAPLLLGCFLLPDCYMCHFL